jgi:hypothetical protein
MAEPGRLGRIGGPAVGGRDLPDQDGRGEDAERREGGAAGAGVERGAD